MSLDVSVLKDIAIKEVNEKAVQLNEISQELWKNPELAFEEKKAQALLASYLENEGFEVSKEYPLKTSFIAKYGNPDGIKVGICCEYDALPDLGHACGHNLIAEAGVGAALGLKAVVDSNKALKMQIIVYGTPAEEGGGGKIFMIEKGVFDEVDFCMMSHPSPLDISSVYWLARIQYKIVFHGKTSHAAAAPWEGINALDAAVACYNNVSMLRQQMKPTNRIHCTIVDGGKQPNIIPERAELSFYIRSLSLKEAEALASRVRKCAEGAALASGCTVEVNEPKPRYDAVYNNIPMVEVYERIASTKFGVVFEPEEIAKTLMASTDMGNVSAKKPSIHPVFKIPTKGANHTHEFTDATGSADSQHATLVSAKCMAMTALEVVCDPQLWERVKEDFAKL